ncbi:MAG: glycosyltransferase, partial [Ilumatobacteraceae bacterium]
MESTATAPAVPAVVAVMVVHEPGAWFDDVLAALAAQDYPNLKCLFLVSGEPGDLPARIRAAVPGCFVRGVEGNPGFGASANQVLSLVQGAHGLFCFLHDDVVLESQAIRLLVEEMYRSNAGIVGPKLVEWKRPSVLQHVGYAVDRFGEVDPLVEPGEIDQEQHDGVRDVFAVPSACLMVRADLFRSIGGFDPSIEYAGDDVDRCWRAHLSGARVVVVPSARVRHREGLLRRLGEGHVSARAARDRFHTVLTLTGGRRIGAVVPQLVLITLLEVVVSLVTGRVRRAGSTLSALVGTVPRLPLVLARRREVAPLRVVPDLEVASLQRRGSARLASFVRGRLHRATDPEAANERRWREAAGSAPVVVWAVVLLLLVVGSRHLITGGVPRFGEYLAFPASPSDVWASFASGWSAHGLGSSTAAPTGLGLVAIASVATLFHMGLLQTLAVVGLYALGVLGAYRLGTLFPSPRARLVLLAVFAAVPLPSHLLSAGQWTGLIVYATVPWVVHLLRRLSGLDPYASADGDVDGVVRPGRRRRVRLVAQLSLVTAVASAFAPVTAVVVLVLGGVLGLATMAVGTRVRAGLAWIGGAATAVALSFVLLLPWSATLFGSGGWTAVVGVPGADAPRLGLHRLASFGLGLGSLTTIAVALHLPVLVAPLVASSWRFAWAVRSAAMVAVFGALAVLGDRGVLPLTMPAAGVLLVPVALGVAISAACLAASFETDVLGGSFGWRQPLGVLSAAAVVLGVVPGVVAAGDGSWHMPHRTLTTVLGELATDPASGDYRVLWVGDPRALPVAGWEYEPGIAFAITDDGPLTLAERWPGRPSVVEQEVATALRRIGDGVTLRGGRLLAPFAIRYVVVPVADGFNGTLDAPLPVPVGLAEVLDDQLDLASPLTSPPNYLVFENAAYAPTRAVLTPSGAAASALAGEEAGTRADLFGAVPFAVGAPDIGPATGDIPAGTLHVAIPYDERWSLEVAGQRLEPRRSFGSNMAWDIAEGGPAVLRYDTNLLRSLWLAVWFLLWTALAVGASRLDTRRWLAVFTRREPVADDLDSDDATVVELTTAFDT